MTDLFLLLEVRTTDLARAYDMDPDLIPMLKYSTVESMEHYFDLKECHREFKDIKEVPPMALIYLQSFMKRAWTWDRLVPWRDGYVPLKHYMDYYLSKYLEKNASLLPDVRAEAKRCLEMEKQYVDSHGGPLSEKDATLSCKITKLAENMRDSGSSSVMAAAGLMCIAEEARLMSNLGSRNKMFRFSNKVRRAASKLMMYQGPESLGVAAAMLGMAKEARIARELLKKIAESESFERFEVCKEARDCSLNLLIRFKSIFVREAHATSATDKTEGYAISEKSADDKFAGNKNSMDIDQNKKRKRTPKVEDNEGMATYVQSVETVTKVRNAGNVC